MQNLEKLLEKLNQKLEYNNQLNYQILMSNIITNLDIDKKDKQILLLLLQNRDRNFIRINDNEEIYENITSYLKLFKPLALPLEKLIRVGGKNDGGYVMHQFNGGGDCVKALSLGVSDYSPWDLEMAQKGFKVIEYDGSIEKGPYNHPNITFYKKFIGTNDDENTITLLQVLKDNNLDEKLPNILQCDIENHEWDMLESVDISLLSKYFSQIIFEFHGLNPEEKDGAQKRLRLLQKINEYFVPIHTHLNNHGKIFYSKGLFWSTTAEVSYLRKNDAKDYENTYRKSGNLIKLDSVTFLSNPEIPLRFI
ncbi:hypothetical protein DU473_04255 [Campylobacter novaezeelandiae]|uniref:Methyltransferase FkbM domain-containing protein n=1 Tax=Campylobacter novaezeelandiae TaxID=2267891 RepID=A0A4Q9JWG2_9BACT|nr:FkbM family methyltransferase [Campylobacter novaezeelandiae]TBR81308.1 hypothetical protein DU473_04255 [Campylobacter novaezeelandiae]